LDYQNGGLKMLQVRLEGMNTNSSETERLANAAVGIAATMAEIINEKLRAMSDKLTTVVMEQEQMTRPAVYPNRYATIPPNGRRCEFTGLGHAKLYHILSAKGVARRQVRVANLRTPGAARGQTLFHVGDMLRFLDELADTDCQEIGDSTSDAD
jgi:hypothetical protein